MKTEKESPLPWKEDNSDGDSIIRDATGEAIFGSTSYYPWVSEKDFPMIVRRVNQGPAFDAMVEALDLIDAEWQSDPRSTACFDRAIISKARAALALANEASK